MSDQSELMPADPAMAKITLPSLSAGKLLGLEVGRGFAALFVLMSHAATIIAEPRFYGQTVADGRLAKFGAGVDFFFVLSGFIITWIHWSDIGQLGRLKNYAYRRFSRIYPPYWAILFPLALAYFLFPSAGQASQHDPANLFFSITLLPYVEQPILGVAWTLVYEIMFYLLFALVIRRGWVAIFPLWGVAILVANILYRTLPFPLNILLDSLNLEFLCGMSAALILRRGTIPAAPALALSGLAVFLILMLIDYPVAANPLAMRIGYGLSAMIGMLGLVEIERSKGIRVPRFLVVMGGASYAIYLIHGVAISMGVQILTRFLPKSLPLGLAMIALTIAGVSAGLLFHFLIEKPLGRWLKPRARKPRPAAATL